MRRRQMWDMALSPSFSSVNDPVEVALGPLRFIPSMNDRTLVLFQTADPGTDGQSGTFKRSGDEMAGTGAYLAVPTLAGRPSHLSHQATTVGHSKEDYEASVGYLEGIFGPGDCRTTTANS